MAKTKASIDDWIKRVLKDDPPRSKSLIITIFGDSIAPRLPEIWLGELITLLEPFGVNERLVRTSGFRLTEEGWLETQREGRRSRYSLTSSGLHRVEHAYHRIYDPPPSDWDGNWTLVILNKWGNIASDRVGLRRELGWEGFGLLAPGIFLHPSADHAALREVLGRLKLARSVTVLQAHDLEPIAAYPGTKLAAECWNLELVADRYRKFNKRFQPALERLGRTLDSKTLDPQMAFVVQTLLIHSFRRVVLHDPRLPSALLPEDWPGHSAYNLCRAIYRRTHLQAQTYLAEQLYPAEQLGDAAHQTLNPDEMFYRRFDGLDDLNNFLPKMDSPKRRQRR